RRRLNSICAMTRLRGYTRRTRRYGKSRCRPRSPNNAAGGGCERTNSRSPCKTLLGRRDNWAATLGVRTISRRRVTMSDPITRRSFAGLAAAIALGPAADAAAGGDPPKPDPATAPASPTEAPFERDYPPPG